MIGLSTQHKDLLLSLHARSAEMPAFCFVFLGNYIFISDQNVITEGIRNRICIFFLPLGNPDVAFLVWPQTWKTWKT